MPGIVSYGAYIPYWRLQRAAIARDARQRRRQGHPQRGLATTRTPRRWASRRPAIALRNGARPAPAVARLVFATTAPAYLDKTNATAIHAALALPVVGRRRTTRRRGALGRRRAAAWPAPAGGLAVLSDIRTGLPGGADEADGGDAAVALLFGDGPDVLAETDRRRHARPASSSTAGARRATRTRRQWEERFGEHAYVPLAERGRHRRAEVGRASTAADLDHVIVTGLPRPGRARRAAQGRRRPARGATPTTSSAIDRQHRRRPRRRCCSPTCSTGPSRARRSPSSQLADGCDVWLLRTTDAVAGVAPAVDRRAQQHRGHPRRPRPTPRSSPGGASCAASRRGGPSPTARPRPPSLRSDGVEVRLHRHRGRGAASSTCRRRG